MEMMENRKVPNFLKNKNNLIIMVLFGILLMVVAMPAGKGKSSATGISGYSGSGSSNQDVQAETLNSEWNESAYLKETEKRLEEILSRLEGAGEVHVIIMLHSTEEKIVEKDMPVVRTQTNEQDSQGGNRIVYDVNMGESTVISRDGSREEPYVVKTISPDVEGVVVMAQGAGDAKIRKNLTEAVQVLFGLEAHKVKVMKCR